ncbi:MAG: GNAT family N-acetyltransferase [Acidobacteria bacterium]|jgi:predicted GNAT family acetyltransferase|nr:GNAT family N-acetyltransferase [Acidobacteriota bacterium]
MSTNLTDTEARTPAMAPGLRTTGHSLTLQLLTSGYEAEVLTFLAERSLHTVCMTGLILENGLRSPSNRGDFYACLDAAGQLEGVALIGHATLIEARSDAVIEAFARLAQNNPRAHLIRGEQEMIERFLGYYQPIGYQPRLMCRELLFEQRYCALTPETVNNLRQATLDDLGQIMTVNAEMIFEESGINPLQTDLTGFSRRTARRIEQGRIWVWIENKRLIFKTDVMSDTPEVIYLEGVFVNSEERGKGYGLLCFTQLCHRLLERAKSICLLVNEHNEAGINLYKKAGYTLQGYYDTVYLQREKPQKDKDLSGIE